MKNTWVLDPAHSEVSFKVKHLMISNVKGTLRNCKLEVVTESDNFMPAEISFSAEAASIDTGSEQRDQHLRSAEFFDAENYPEINFKGTKFEKKMGNDDTYELYGDLTMKGVTKPVKLEVEFSGLMKDPWGNTKAGFSVSGKINRKDWGLNWNAALEAGGVMVSDEVKVNADIQLLKQS